VAQTHRDKESYIDREAKKEGNRQTDGQADRQTDRKEESTLG